MSEEQRRLIIQEYLDTHSLAELDQTYHVGARRHPQFPNLVMLKYSQIDSPMAEPIVQQCRGIILDEANNWRVVSYPFDKFFNYGEPNAAAIDWSTATVYEKLDGSLMTLYWYADAWRVASSGTPDAGGMAHESGIAFAELFWKVFNKCGYVLPDALPESRQFCFMFELMTPLNRIVVPHTEMNLVLIGARELTTFQEYNPGEIALSTGWKAVGSHSLVSLADCVAASCKLRGIDGEGFVVCDDRFRRIKVKSPQYVALAHLKETLSPRAMLDVIRRGESDEFLTYFPELQPVYDSGNQKFDALCDDLAAEYERVKGIEIQKDFALAIRGSRYSSALFALRNGKAKSIREFFATITQQGVERALGMDELK